MVGLIKNLNLYNAHKICLSLRIFVICLIAFFNCSFEPTDLFFKNIKLIPEMLDNEDRTPHLPKAYVNEKTEKIYKPLTMPTGEEEAPAEKIININDLIKSVTFNPQDLPKILPNGDGIDNMFNLSNLGLIDKKKDKKGANINIEFLDPATQKLPILNDFTPVKKMPKKIPIAPGLNAGAKKMEIKNPITDIQINGIDDVLPNSVGAPFKPSDYTLDQIPSFFTEFINEEYNLDQNITDILP